MSRKLLSILGLFLLLTLQSWSQATITVLNGNDTGAGSLRQAIVDIDDGGVIAFNSDLNITLATELSIGSKSVTIDGGGNNIIINGNSVCRVFNVSGVNGKTYTISELTIQNGNTSGDGGGLKRGDETTGILIVTGCTFASNFASGNGGGVMTYGLCNFTNCSFNGNSTLAAGGGAFVHQGSNFTNCTFNGNSAATLGGGVLNYSGGYFINCTFNNNIALGASPSGDETYVIWNGIYTNCLFWNDTSTDLIAIDGAGITFSYCAAKGGVTGTNNISLTESPLVSSADLRLNGNASGGLLCWNSGNDAANSTIFDIAGNPRKKGIIDIGAYESSLIGLGQGTVGNPFQISTLADLEAVSADTMFWSKHFIQTADIDATETSGWNSGAGWSPIGTSEKPFNGNYNGQGHVIDALYINRPSTNNIGFIGFAGGATIENLGLTNCSIVGDEYVGSFVGRNWYANINNCFSTGTVSGRNQIGGFSGQTNDSEINNCYATVNISAEHTYGGFTGWNNGTTTNCYSSGSVSGPPADGYKGGFTGYNTGTITDSFYDLTTSGQNDNVGRGVPKTSAEMKILSTYTDAGWDFKGETTNGTSEIWNLGNERSNGYPYLNWQYPSDPVAIILTTSEIAGITVSLANSGGDITSDGGDAVTARGVCWSTSELPTIADSHTIDGDGMGGFISSITGLARNTKYYVRAYATNSTGTFYGEQDSLITKIFDNGSGTVGDPYQIATLADLRFLSENNFLWNKSFIQTDDIDASETSGWNSGAGWSPIGNSSIKFTGDYNGQNLTINGIYISRSGSDNQGLFGFANGASIENLGLTNVNILARDNVSGLIGTNEYSSVVSNCYVTGSVTGRSNIAGLAGTNWQSTIVRNSFNESTITGSGNSVGGLAGYSGFGAVINDCYNRGNISGVEYIGGITGFNGTAINRCYSTGTVTGTNYVFALADGVVWGAVNNSFWDTETSGIPTSSSGTGKTTAEMKVLSTFNDAGWDFKGETINGFNDIWNLGNERNNGYPYFNWQFPRDPVAIILTTTAITDISVVSATSGGDIITDGGEAVYERGVCWSTSELPTIADSYTTDGDGMGEFISSITGLARNTTYHVRAYATNVNGTFYGEQVSFTTSAMNVTVYVDSSKIDDTDDGLSWKAAKKSLQSALTFAIDGDEIWVAKGTYYPEIEVGGTGDRYKTFQMKEGVAIIGGFAGGETAIDERTDFGNGGTNETILSGDIGTPGDNSDNCYHVFYHPSGMVLTAAAVLDGFTITGGNANAANPHSDGGGICTYSSPTISNVTFLSNSGSFGGGLYTRHSTSTLTNITFILNSSSEQGGGMFNDSSSPVLNNVTFSKNSAVNYGGGLMSVFSSLTLNSSIVWGNTSSIGNEIYIWDGTTTLNYSCYANGTNDVIGSNFIATNHNITSDPKFIDARGGDYRLLGSSPCVNTGSNSYNSTSTDIRGQVRIQNTTIDMGAYEWTAGLDPSGIEENLSIGDQTFSTGAIECFNAYDTITVEGSDVQTVIIESDATVDFIAGKSIRFLNGFWAKPGSFVHAWITTNESFCDAYSGSPIVALPEEKSVEEQTAPSVKGIIPAHKMIKLYPNPNNGRFTISLTNIGSESTVSVYNMLGVRVYSALVNEQTDLDINLPELQKGIYFVRINDQKVQFTKKMIVN